MRLVTRLWIVYFIFSLLTLVSSKTSNDLVGFYHIGVDSKNGNHIKIIDEQISLMDATGLLERVKQIRYGVVHNQYKEYGAYLKPMENQSFTLDPARYGEKFMSIGNFSGKYSHETETLTNLYDYCQSHPLDKVLYFHTKGTFHKRGSNNNMRSILDTFILSKGCLNVLDDYDTCGVRLSPAPFIHYSGNFWWATCRYINTLIDPALMQVGKKQSLHQSVQNKILKKYLEQPYSTKRNAELRIRTNLGLHRHWSEAWLGSAPYINGADCMPKDIAPEYLFGYAKTQPLYDYARSIKDTNSFVKINCTAAATNISSDIFKEAFKRHLKNEPIIEVKMSIYKSQLIYNQDPHSLIDWRKRLGEYIPLSIL